ADWAGFLASAGSRDASASAETLHWRFASSEEASAFSRELFGLHDGTNEDALALAAPGLRGGAGGWVLPWDMVFGSAAA
ncbi:MAG TPA: hypothetical protein VH854_02440, partial [Thermoanaerobaculia bacterium]|nr:hypothetical protein [Thermoanaerobaculia bacterium]